MNNLLTNVGNLNKTTKNKVSMKSKKLVERRKAESKTKMEIVKKTRNSRKNKK